MQRYRGRQPSNLSWTVITSPTTSDDGLEVPAAAASDDDEDVELHVTQWNVEEPENVIVDELTDIVIGAAE